jgi:hypothetical protein
MLAEYHVKVQEFTHLSKKIESELRIIQSFEKSFNDDQKVEGKALKSQLNTAIDELQKCFELSDVAKEQVLQISTINKPKVTGDQIRESLTKINWRPKNLHEFMFRPFDVYRGIDRDDVRWTSSKSIHPSSLFYKLWTSFYSAYMIFFGLFMPVTLSFPIFYDYLDPLIISGSIFISADLVIRLKTGIIVEQEVILDPSLILRRLMGWKLFFDILTCIPYAIIIDLLSKPGYDREFWRVLSMINGCAVAFHFFSQRTSFLTDYLTKYLKHRVNDTVIGCTRTVIIMGCYW